MKHLALLPPDDEEPPPGANPADLAGRQAAEAMDWLEDVRAGAGYSWRWLTLHRLTGRLLPGWFVTIGGYPKTAKTTLLQTQARHWAEHGIPVVYIGTETKAALLRLQSAALALGLSVERVITGNLTPAEMQRIEADMDRQHALASFLSFADTESATLLEVLKWLHWGADQGCKVVIFDHLHQMDLGTASDRYGALSDAVRTLARAAVARDVVLVCAAQFRENRHDPIANHEVPGDAQWFGTSALQQIGACNLQLYRPMRPGVSDGDKKLVKQGDKPLADILRPNTVGVRCSVHRYRNAQGELRMLHIDGDDISDPPGEGEHL